MTIPAAIILAVLAFAFISYPLLRQRRYSGYLTQSQLEEQATRDTAERMLRQLEFDHATGVVSDEDYNSLKERYQEKAGGAERGGAHRAARPAASREDDIERQVLEMRKAKAAACKKCGAKILPGDKFCTHCGASAN